MYSRFIAAYSSCTTKSLSKLLTIVALIYLFIIIYSCYCRSAYAINHAPTHAGRACKIIQHWHFSGANFITNSAQVLNKLSNTTVAIHFDSRGLSGQGGYIYFSRSF